MADPIWQTAPYYTDIVPIADDGRKIQVTVAGQRRVSSAVHETLQPLVIIEAGLGGVAEEHVVVAQLIAPFARVLRYSRAGYAASTLGDYKGPVTATSRARELSMLLKTIGLPPPYIMVAHSFGGVMVRTFLEERNKGDVVGMVLIECLPLFQGMNELPESNIMPTLRGGGSDEDGAKANGFFYHIVLTPQQQEEMKAARQGINKEKAAEKDFFASEPSVAHINQAEGVQFTKDDNGFVTDLTFAKKPLGDSRLSVILGDFPRDFEALIDYAKFHDHGDAAVHRKANEILKKAKRTNWVFQKSQTALANGESRVRVADGTGRTHNLHMTRPDIVAEEVRWVMEGAWDLISHTYWPGPQ